MKIAFFDAKPYDKQSFDKYGGEAGFKFKYFEDIWFIFNTSFSNISYSFYHEIDILTINVNRFS